MADKSKVGRRLLVWDAPNMDMCLSEAIGEKASVSTRPEMGAVLRWFLARATPGEVVEACVFANVAKGMENAMAGWVASLRHLGFAVFVKPKQHRRDDVDAEMLRHIERRVAQGGVLELVVASHDAKAFADPLARHARAGVVTSVLGYRERDVFAAESDLIDFVDMEDVPGAFARPLPRTNLFDLPTGGRWFDSFVELVPPALPFERPDREAVLSSVVDAVDEAAAEGRSGLTLAEAGDLVRTRWPALRFEDIGFSGVGELLDALAATGAIRVVRDGEGPTLLVPAVIDLAAEEAAAVEAVAIEAVAVEAVAIEAVDTEPPAAEPPAAEPAAAEPPAAEPTAAERPAAEPATAGREPVAADAANPIYRAFRYEPPAPGA